MAKARVMLAVVALGVLMTAPVRAQASGSRFAVEAAGSFGTLTGQDFEGTDASAGFDAGAFVNLGSWQFGAGYARTAYGHEDAAGDFVVSSVFIEPRLRFGSESARWRPYLATRIGRVSASIDEPSTGGTISVDGDGLLLGAAAGLLIDLAASFQLALAAHVSFISVDYGGDSGFSSEEGGGQVGVRAGLRFNIPRRE